ncbi:MAG: hypothetical protein IT285_03380 [Bdellovibrionales bacterium]|nr:hypothetical protein [Bdellovibrionales bacterium]
MSHPAKFFAALLCLVAVSGGARAEEPAAAAPAGAQSTAAASGAGLKLFALRAGVTSLSQGSIEFGEGSSYSITGKVGWTPIYTLSDAFEARGELGASFPKTPADEFFIVANAEASASYRLSSWMRVEAGGGIQFWSDNEAMHPVATAGFVFPMSDKLMGVVDRVFVDYSMVFTGVFETHQFQLGVAI